MTLRQWSKKIGKRNFRVFLGKTELTKRVIEDGKKSIVINPIYMGYEVSEIKPGCYEFLLYLEKKRWNR